MCLLGNDATPPRREIMRHYSKLGKTQQTHTHTCVWDFTVQKQGKQKHASPPLTLCKYARRLQAVWLPKQPWQQAAIVFKTLLFQSNYLRDRPCGFNVATGRVVRARGKYKPFNNFCKNLHAIFNAHLQTRQVYSPRTHAPTQTIRYIKCLRSTDKKGKKKSPGYRFHFWLFGERKEKRGREGRRDGPEDKKQTTAVIS